MSRSFAAFVVAALVASNSHADTTAQNLDKYYRLRARLLTDFTSAGPAQGQSQPAPERTDAQGLMKWGDGTIALGFYLGVLATEHYLLANPGRYPGADHGDATRLDRTREELYNALLAMERLDNVADASFPAPCTTTPALNGFFIRDDVPADFYTHFPGITTIQSDFTDPTLTNKEESQDQVYHVQHGLALVIALVPANVVVHGKALRGWALEQAQRIVAHFATGDWNIRNPACSNRVVNRGGSTIGYSYGETLAAAFLTDGALMPTTDALWMSVWGSLRNATNPAYSNENNLHMALAIMAVGDGYGADTPDVMWTLSQLQDWPLYPLLHRVLHPASPGFCTTGPAVNVRVRTMLDELPADGEPACPGASGPAVHGFTTHNRFIRGKDQAYVGPSGCEGVRYHGLDYMLLHNLYAIATPLTWNGDPAADPCAILPDNTTPTDQDAGTTGGGGTNPSGGCGCQSTDRGATSTWVLFGLVLVWLRRRRV